MSEAAKRLTYRLKGLSPTEWQVMFILADHANPIDGERCLLSADDIVSMTGLSVRSVRRALAALARLGHIKREATKPGGIHATVVQPDPGVIGPRAPVVSAAKRKIKPALARAVMERDAYRCVICGTHLNLGCDHIIPESRGGPTTLDNLQTMCQPCNSAKGTRLPA